MKYKKPIWENDSKMDIITSESKYKLTWGKILDINCYNWINFYQLQMQLGIFSLAYQFLF